MDSPASLPYWRAVLASAYAKRPRAISPTFTLLEQEWIGGAHYHRTGQYKRLRRATLVKNCSLPESVQFLRLSNTYTSSLPVLPEGLLTLHTGQNLTSTICTIPASLVSLTIGYRYGSSVPDLPEGLTVLDMYRYDSHYVPRLPSSLRTLVFRDCCRLQGISKLPATLHTLHLGDHYNQELPPLPSSLQTLILGNHFNQALPCLPPTLLILRIGNSFNYVLPSLPESLRILHLGDAFTRPLPALPLTLRSLHLGSAYARRVPVLPCTLRSLHLRSKFDSLLAVEIPNTLRSLLVRNNHCLPAYLPDSLQSLFLLNYCPAPLLILPRRLRHFSVEEAFDMPLPKLPNTLRILTLGYCTVSLPEFARKPLTQEGDDNHLVVRW